MCSGYTQNGNQHDMLLLVQSIEVTICNLRYCWAMNSWAADSIIQHFFAFADVDSQGEQVMSLRIIK